MHHDIFFRPDPHWVGDVIPWTDGNEIRLYYLLERRQEPRPGTPWHLAVTRDLVHYEDCGEALPSGGAEAEDLNAYTGSVVQDDSGLYHLFYTANNPSRLSADGRSVQLVAHATSTDMRTWTKRPEDTFGAPTGYDPADWRDPHVYRVPGEDHWSLVLAARHLEGPERRRGVVARLVSSDLRQWRPVEPLWDPHRFVTQECPEVFRIGQWWYLVYSEFTDRFVTRYRISRSPQGPWQAPERDTLDGRGFYAAKSVDWHGRRLFFGWIASRRGAKDDGPWLWAGTMACLEAVQAPDGTLDMRIPEEVLRSYSEPLSEADAPVSVQAPTSYACRVLTPDTGEDVRISADLEWTPGTREISLLLRTDASGETGYVLRLEPAQRRMVLDRWPRREPGPEQWHLAGDVPHFIELERPVPLDGGRVHLDVISSKELLQCCVDRAVVLSTSAYARTTGRVGIAALDGTVTLTSLRTYTRP
ncbi:MULTISPECIES: glycoside hydrolase [unclassified Actinomyces]|uniref:glycoside hydrolase n=1 Tax=unclassified Actinomyces TaxID=2609248 RepID=UPI0020182A65|nr:MULTISPECIES: glycoside hydrolase [unclassified Actinomyces]MCL3777910.1 glycoside hydrolase [Actinomyces sp. AC-20-1]MCL3788790.1 glycoside hydrolase [Actinomyces sp. 187325]MCL3791126.1 glycoside hydrolase [Actinomyces sp. 186855]MCL3793687.1 glycoside hydrolase [Actinomyces sp. 217892]